ncbi:MAG: FAD-binding oxidoreductase [Candidatus Competibacterales bacterium]
MNAPSAALLDALKATVADLRTDADSLATYGRDWTTRYRPQPAAVALPAGLDEVVALVKLANQQRLALVPSGGRTGLSGGAVALQGEVVVSFERMNRILHFEPKERSVTVQAGVVTEALQQFAAERGLFYPVDFAARGSSHIGGNIATNAGGIKVIRYGMTRDWVTGLKVVTGRGDCLELNKGLVKNATGYDLRHLFIGSEGTLGLVVEATIELTTPPQEPSVMVLGTDDLEALLTVFDRIRGELPLLAFEFFTDQALAHVLAKGLKPPFDQRPPYYALVEFENPADAQLDTALKLFESALERGLVVDGVISQNSAQALDLWRLREDITESLAPHKPYKNDISVRVSQVAAFLTAMEALFAEAYPDFQVVWFGHIGDGNLHISVLKPQGLAVEAFAERCEAVSEQLFEVLESFGGSVSAEHGVGLVKKPFLHYTRHPSEIDYLRGIKRVFDPNGILNPGKLFD